MTLPLFDPQFQSGHLESRILVALERLSEVFRVLLWEAAWPSGLSPLQVQILLFCDGHRAEWCRVAGLAKEFNLTKPTISDAVRVLVEKAMLERVVDPADARSHYLRLLPAGKDLAMRSGAFAGPVWSALQHMDKGDQAQFYGSLIGLIDRLQKAGVISLSRMCFTCLHYRPGEGGHYCTLLEKVLATAELRMDCPEHIFREG